MIVLLLSTFWIHVNAQFNKQITAEEQSKEQEYTNEIIQNEKRVLAHFEVNEAYEKEIRSVIHYYETLRFTKGYKLEDSKLPTKEEWLFFQDYQKDVYKLLFLSGTYIATPNYHHVYLLRKKLNLSEETLRTLADKAVALKIDMPDLDEDAYWNYEFNELSSILTDEQMDYFLRKKNIPKTWKKVNKSWNLLCQNNDFYKEDSTNIKSQLYNYYYRIAIADELYKNDSIMKREAHMGIRRFASPIISKIEIIQKRTKRKEGNIFNAKNTTSSKNNKNSKDYYTWLPADQNLGNSQVAKAIILALGANGRINREKAFIQLKQLADTNDPFATNALALMYLKGYGTNADTIAAINYWKIAGDNEFYDAFNNIGFLHKTEDNFYDIKKSYLSFLKAAESGNSIGSYMVGYMHYKGIGCEQNYETAIKYLKIGANKNYAPSLYMLGLCYRNGYGIEQNEQSAKLFLEQAASQSHKEALKELELKYPENNNSVTRNYDRKYSSVTTQYSQEKKQDKNISNIESGEYIGTLTTLDWSGKYVIEEIPLTLSLSKKGEIITGEWCEDGNTPIKISAYIKGSKLIFNDQIQKPLGRYKNMKHLSSFQEADLHITKNDRYISLVGTLKMYSPQTKEKECPTYLSLTKENENRNIQTVSVSPNPFSEKLYLYLNIYETSNLFVSIHDIQGNLRFKYNAETLLTGKHQITLQPNLTKGTYIMNVYINEKNTKLTIISK